jgi:hypothetical protein
MKTLLVYFRLYASCLKKAFAGLKNNAWTVLLPVALLLVNGLLIPIVAGLGVIGSFILPLIWAAGISCYLYFVSETVAGAPVRISELQRSIGAYFWSVINLMFVLWIAQWVLDIVLRGNRNAGTLWQIVMLAVVILLNPAPEIIYEKGTYGGLATVQACIEFIQQNWIEWFIPNLLGMAALYALFDRFGGLLIAVIGGALVHFGMLFRGHLFGELDGTSHRQRMFKYRNAA